MDKIGEMLLTQCGVVDVLVLFLVKLIKNVLQNFHNVWITRH